MQNPQFIAQARSIMLHRIRMGGIYLALLGAPFVAGHAAELTVVPLHQAPGELAVQEKIIVRALLEDMGLRYPNTDPDPRPAPAPGPEPAPTPAPTPAPAPTPGPSPKPSPAPDKTDGFFSDDDFFDKEGGFDEVVAGFDREVKRIRQTWDKEYQDMLAKWDKERQTFLNFRKYYREQTSAFGVENLQAGAKLPLVAATNAPLDLTQMADGEFHLIPSSLSLAIKDQRERGTCTAFASVRAIESLMAQNGHPVDLSEQYFYWQSKPECQFTGCTANDSSEGTNPVRSLEIANRAKPLPPEDLCPYEPRRNKDNITFAPLRSCDVISDDARAARPGSFSGAANADALVRSVLANRPVVLGTTLSEGFMNPKIGVVLNRGAVRDLDKQGHAAGHAMLVVGLIKLPQALRSQEGRFCAITANSWGEGWGKGGYVCLTESWLNNFSMLYVVLDSVQVSDQFVVKRR